MLQVRTLRCRLQQVLNGNLLEHEVRLAPFVNDPHMFVINPAETRVAGTTECIQQNAILLGPVKSVIKADLYGVVITARL